MDLNYYKIQIYPMWITILLFSLTDYVTWVGHSLSQFPPHKIEDYKSFDVTVNNLLYIKR